MVLLASTQTQTANRVPLYVPMDGEGNATVPNELSLNNGVLSVFDNELLLNGQPVGGAGNPFNWSAYPAISDVNFAGHTLSDSGNILFGPNVLGVNGSNELTYNGNVLSVGGITPAEWSTYPAISNVDIAGHTLSNSGNILFGSNVLGINSVNELTYNGAVLATGSVSPAGWSNYPAVSGVVMGTHGISFSPFTSGGVVTSYSNSRFDTNIQIAGSDVVVLPSFNAFVNSFNVGGILNPAGSASITTSGTISLNSIVGVDINSAAGVSILGGGGVSINGGGGILVDGGNVAINGAGVEIAGLVGLELLGGGSVQINGGGGVAINGGGGISILGGGGVLVTGGLGLVLAGGAGVSIDSLGTLTTPTATIGNLTVSKVNGNYSGSLTTIPISITGSLTYTLNLSDVGKYFVLNTTIAGAVINFTIGTFPVNGTFYIKNCDFTNRNSISITFNSAPAIGNNLLSPPLNSVLCVGDWNGTTLSIY